MFHTVEYRHAHFLCDLPAKGLLVPHSDIEFSALVPVVDVSGDVVAANLTGADGIRTFHAGGDVALDAGSVPSFGNIKKFKVGGTYTAGGLETGWNTENGTKNVFDVGTLDIYDDLVFETGDFTTFHVGEVLPHTNSDNVVKITKMRFGKVGSASNPTIHWPGFSVCKSASAGTSANVDLDFQKLANGDEFGGEDMKKASICARRINVNPAGFKSIDIKAPTGGGRFVCGTLDASRQGDGGTALNSVEIAEGVDGSHCWEHDQIGEPVTDDTPHDPPFGDGGTPEESLREFHKDVYYSYPVIGEPHHYEWDTDGIMHSGKSETEVMASQGAPDGTPDEAFYGKPDDWMDKEKYITEVTPIYEYSWVDKYPRDDGIERLNPRTEMQGWTTANKLPEPSAAYAGEDRKRYDMGNITTVDASDAKWDESTRIGDPDYEYHAPEALPATGEEGDVCMIWQTYWEPDGTQFYQRTRYICTESSVEKHIAVPWVMVFCQRSTNPIRWDYKYKEYRAEEDTDYEQVKIKHTYRAAEPDSAYKLGGLRIHNVKSLRKLILPAIGTIDVGGTGIRNRNGAAVEIGGLDCLREEGPDWTGRLDPDWDARVD